tara:strand:- start:13 stop:168 length:156 start_codon:yes stop_codon:yes gene_type:complete
MLFSQNEWFYSDYGNAFDGYTKMAYVKDDSDRLAITVINQSGITTLDRTLS